MAGEIAQDTTFTAIDLTHIEDAMLHLLRTDFFGTVKEEAEEALDKVQMLLTEKADANR